MNDRVLSFLGICRRAKKLVIGAEVTEESVRCGKSRCAERSKEELSHALGRLCAVLSVEDEGFAERLREMID